MQSIKNYHQYLILILVPWITLSPFGWLMILLSDFKFSLDRLNPFYLS